MKNYRTGIKVWLERYRTLRGIKESDCRVRASCQRCRGWFPVNIDKMIEMHGPDLCIVGRYGKCPNPSCTGPCIFLGSPREGTPFARLAE